MKPKTFTIVTLCILATLFLGAVAINVMSAPPTLKLKVKWRPVACTLDNEIPDPWNAEVFFAPPRPLNDLDPETIRLEGLYKPEADPYMHPRLARLVIPFDGYDVIKAILPKLPHMGPGIYEIPLEITGRLLDGTPFRGSGIINITVPEYPPP